MKKAVFTLVVDNYRPDICERTLPSIEAYAKKIGADFKVITERKYPQFPPAYEKVQVHELGRDYDYCINMDVDFIIDKNAPDFTTGILPNYVGFFEMFDAHCQFELDECFKNDGRDIGIAANFVLTDRNTHDLWEPLSISWEELRKLIKGDHQASEYCISRNLAKHHYKFTGLNYHDDIPKLFYHLGVSTK